MNRINNGFNAQLSYKKKIKFRCSQSLSGFTLAEVLITLLIIGVISSIVIPVLINDIDNSRWTSSRERTVYNIREAARMISKINSGIGGLGTSDDFSNELRKYLSISKSCDSSTLSNCFHITIKSIQENNVTVPVNGASLGFTFTQVTAPDNAVGMILSNGTIMSVLYNSVCTETPTVYNASDAYAQNHVCANIIYDTNGFAAPNQVGKDIGFVSIINPTNTVTVGPSPDLAALASVSWSDAKINCNAKGDTWHLPTKDELNSLFYNKVIIGNIDVGYHWSSMGYSSDSTMAWYQMFDTGHQSFGPKATAYMVRCVKR